MQKRQETIVPKGEYDNHDLTGLQANRDKLIADKKATQSAFVNDLIHQWYNTTPQNPQAWLGVTGTCQKYGITVSTWENWCNDNDFVELLNQYKAVRRNILKDRLFNGLISGVGVNVTAFIMGVLNKIDDEFKSNDNQAITINMTGGIRSVQPIDRPMSTAN